MKRRYDKAVYEALRNAGMSNREIAKHLDIDESSVRRALGKPTGGKEKRFLVTVTELD